MDLHSALKKYFGHAAFRPLQENIIRDALAGHDVFVLMPTGGGSRFVSNCRRCCAMD